MVVTDRYVDSSVAYQGAGRDLGVRRGRDSAWATDGLVPALTVLLDLDPAAGPARRRPDRLESEGDEFHQRARKDFLALAAAEPDRYLVIDGTRPPSRSTGGPAR